MRRVLLTLFALFLVLALAALWYASHQGFTSKWRNSVSAEFRKRGFEVTLRRLTLDPTRGLVARDVRVFDAHDRRRTLAVISEMALQVNFANLVRRKTFLDALDLHDANLSLPLDPEKPRGEKIEIAHLNARLFLPPQQVYLAHADADVLGLHVSASGRLIHPQAFREWLKSPSVISLELLAQVFEEVSTLRFEGDPPEVSLTFSGDLAEPQQIYVDVALWAERIRRQKYLLKSLYLNASWRDGVLDLKQLLAADPAGELRLSGLWEPALPRVQAQLRSSIDAAALVRACGDFPWLDDFVFYAPPAVDLRVDMTFGGDPKFMVLGQVATGKFAWRSVVFDRAATGFSWDGVRWSLRDARLVRGNGEEVSGDALQDADEFRARFESTLNPKALRPWMPDNLAGILAQLDFSQAPHLTLETHGRSPSFNTLRAEGELTLGHTSFRGVPAENAHATWHYADHVLSVAPFHLQRTEGEGSGNLSFDFGRDEIRFDQVRTCLNPPEVAMWIDPALVKDILPYHFLRQPPNLLIDGPVGLANGKATQLAIQVDAPAGMDYTFCNKSLRFSELRGKLLFAMDRLKIADFSASLFGGVLGGGADISLLPGSPDYRGRATLTNVDWAGLGKLYFDAANPRGRLNGRCDFSGKDANARSLQGQGEVSLADGNIFSVPFLRSFSEILEKLAPGLGRGDAHRATATFTIADGAITTDDLAVEANGFSMRGGGRLLFLDDKMNFDMRICGQGLPGLLLAPVSRLFEYTADQKLSQAPWRLKLVPSVN